MCIRDSFTAGLLVVWLGSQALENMLRPDMSKQAVGQAFGQTFDRRDRHHARVRMDVLSSLHMPWNRPWGLGLSGLPIKPIDDLTWFLLDLEARRSGIEISPREVDRFLTAFRIPGQILEHIRDRQGISIDRIKECIADFMRIERLGHLAAGSVKVSQPEVMHFIRDTREKVTVRMSLFRAADFADPNRSPEPGALEKHFHQYRNDLPGSGTHGYGYRWPDRIRLEYVATDLDTIEKAIRITRNEAMDYWREHRKDYTKQVPVASGPTSGPTTGTRPTSSAGALSASTGPATTSADGSVASAPTTSTRPTTTEARVKTFDEAYEEVLADMKKQRAPALAEKLIREASRQIMEPWYDLQPDPQTGYKPAPPGVDVPGYLDRIAADVCRRNDVPGDCLRVVKPSGWLTRTEVAALEGIGRAVLEGQPAEEEHPAQFVDAAFQVQNLYMPPKDRRVHHGLALYELFHAPLRDTKDGAPHNYYIFRVVGAQKEHVPEALEDVREQVRRDLIELAGYEEAGQQARTVLASARSKGLEAAIKADRSLVQRLGDRALMTPEPFARRRSFGQAAIQFGLPLTVIWPLEELGVTEERKMGFLPMQVVAEAYEAETERFIEACFGLASDRPTSAPTTTSRPTETIALVEMPRSKQWVVVEFVRIDRVSTTEYAQVWRQAQVMLQSDRTIGFLKRWYDPDHVRRRTGYVPAHEEQEG